MQKKLMPDQFPEEDLQQYIKRTWENDVNIREEFGQDFDCYRCYVQAEAAGQIKLLKPQAGLSRYSLKSFGGV